MIQFYIFFRIIKELAILITYPNMYYVYSVFLLLLQIVNT